MDCVITCEDCRGLIENGLGGRLIMMSLKLRLLSCFGDIKSQGEIKASDLIHA